MNNSGEGREPADERQGMDFDRAIGAMRAGSRTMWSTPEGQPGPIRLQQGSHRKQGKRRWKNLYTQISAKRLKKSLPLILGFMNKVNEAVI